MANSTVRIDIQGLRALAVIAVLLFHFKVPGFQGGYVGVDIFFVISGFLMTSIIAKKIESDSFSYLDFIWFRAVRIYPPMLALLLTMLVLGYFFLNPADYGSVAKRAISAIASLSNIWFYTESLDYFAPAQQSNWLLHLWSLSVEFQFYVLYPLLLVAAHRLKRVRAVSLLLLAASLAASVALTPGAFPIPIESEWGSSSLFCRIFSTQTGIHFAGKCSGHQSAAFFLLPTRVWEFIAGGLVWAYGGHLPAKWSKWVSGVGLGMILVSILIYREAMAFPGWVALIPVVGTALVIAARQDLRIFSNPVTQFFGSISYSLYLWHWPVWIAAQHYHLPATILTTCLLMTASVGLGAASYYLIERPSSAFRHQARRSFPSIAANSGACAVVACSALAVVVNQGYPDRVPEMIRNVVPHFTADIAKLPGAGVCFLKLDQGPSEFTDRCFTRKHADARATVFVWGDSYARHFGLGLAAAPAFEDINLLGTTSPGCFPVLGAPSKFNSNCAANNRRTLEEIDRIKPDTIILGGRWLYAATDAFDIASALVKTAEFLLAKGIKVVVVGPNPEWMPTLSQLLLQESFSRGGAIPDRMIDASQKDGWLLDQRISEALSRSNVKYVSLYKLLCSAKGCRTTVPRDGQRELVVHDYGHLTVPAAEFIVSSSLAETDLR